MVRPSDVVIIYVDGQMDLDLNRIEVVNDYPDSAPFYLKFEYYK